LTSTSKSDILFAVMRVETQKHIRNEASKIEDITGMVDILAQTNLVDKAHIQLRLGQLKQRLETISDTLREIEHSEDLEWLSDESVTKSLRKRGIDERSIAGEDELAEAKVLRCLERKRNR